MVYKNKETVTTASTYTTIIIYDIPDWQRVHWVRVDKDAIGYQE